MRKLFAVVLWVATATLAFPQLPNSTIDGRVTDPQGLIVAGAHVTLTSTTRSVSRDTITNSDGLYTIPSLPAGTYNLRVEATGFALSEASDVTLDVGKTITANISLHIANANDIVQVTGLNQTSISPSP